MEVFEANLIYLLEAERLLQNSKLKLYISEKIVDNLTMNNCYFYFQLAKLFFLNDLHDFLLNSYLKCYLTKIDTKMFFNLSFADVSTLISCSKLQIDSEFEMFNAVIDWVTYKADERKVYIDKLLSLVRLPLLTKDELINVVRAHPLCSKNKNCKSVVRKALEIKENKSRLQKKFWLENRYYCSKLDCKEIYFLGVEHYSGKQLEFSFRTNSSMIDEVKLTNKIHHQMSRCVCVVSGEKIYCMVGQNTPDRSKPRSFDVYCRRTDTWKRLAEIPGYRTEFCACSFMGRIYLFGGHHSAGEQNMEYDAEEDRWRGVAVRERRFSASCAVFNGQCVVVGGYVGGWRNRIHGKYILGIPGIPTRTAECFDRRLNKWSRLPPMKAARYFPGLLPMGNKLFVVAGAKGLYRDTHEVYDCLTEKFSFIAPSLPGIVKFTYNGKFLFTDGNLIYVFSRLYHFDSIFEYLEGILIENRSTIVVILSSDSLILVIL